MASTLGRLRRGSTFGPKTARRAAASPSLSPLSALDSRSRAWSRSMVCHTQAATSPGETDGRAPGLGAGMT